MTPGLRRRPSAPLASLFGPLLPLPDGEVWPVGWFRCVACPEVGATEPALAAATPCASDPTSLHEEGLLP
jgi:hypothetical protein